MQQIPEGIVRMTSQEAVISGENKKVSFAKHIVIIWQRFLGNHVARIRLLQERCSALGYRLTALEIASQDKSYIFPEFNFSNNGFEHICCFAGSSYHQFESNEIYEKVFSLLTELKPDIIFAPATAFPEGMAAFAYRLTSGVRVVMMDDAWEYTDRRGPLTKVIKRLISKNIDGVFIPAPSHLSYYVKMGFPEGRVVFGICAVDNDFFSQMADQIRKDEAYLGALRNLPKNYFLFVGRFLPRKGLETLIKAYKSYRKQVTRESWGLVLVGTGSHLDSIQGLAEGIPEIRFVGLQFGEDLCHYYGLARVLIVPSVIDQWGLVINEGMASGLPVIVSKGCGAAKTCVQEGENGWTFEPGDDETLTKLMIRASSLSSDALKEMGRKSQSIISEWSLDRFADGVLKAIEIPRRPPAGLVSNILTKLWKGRVRVN
jgi:glycosyltransferase involved in cell wall biosynthesis